jgi:hypothetical protein
MLSFFSDSFSLVLGVICGIIGGLLVALAFREPKQKLFNLVETIVYVITVIAFLAILLIPTIFTQFMNPWGEIALGMLLGILGSFLVEIFLQFSRGEYKYKTQLVICFVFLVIVCFFIYFSDRIIPSVLGHFGVHLSNP